MIGKLHLGGGGDGIKNSDNEPHDMADLLARQAYYPNQYGFNYSFITHSGIQGPPYVYFEDEYFVRVDPENLADVSRSHGSSSDIRFWDHGVYATANGVNEISSKTREGLGDTNWAPSQTGIIYTKKIRHFIDAAAGDPFFIYYNSQAVHIPHTPPFDFDPDDTGRPRSMIQVAGQVHRLKNNSAGSTADMVYEFDLQVGNIVTKLNTTPDPRTTGGGTLLENTLIFITSDNGGLATMNPWYDWGIKNYDSTGILRGFKGSVYEGGHRVPFIAHWPNRFDPVLKKKIEVVTFLSMYNPRLLLDFFLLIFGRFRRIFFFSRHFLLK